MRRFLGILLLVAACPMAAADGKFFGTLQASKPKIPFQRAFISYRDGVETMIVESPVLAPSQDLVWVIPVPSRPISVKAAGKGTLQTLYALDQPRIQTFSEYWWLGFVAATVALLFSFEHLGLAARQGPQAPKRFFLNFLGGSAIVYLFVVLLSPMYAGTKSSASISSGLTSQLVGSFSVDLVPPASGDQVSRTLNALGADLSGSGEVLRALSREGWWFVAARVRTPKQGLAAHPLQISFRTEKPVYPMRLTGTAVDELALDLYVAHERGVAAEGMTLMSSRLVHLERRAGEPVVLKWSERDGIGHPDLVPSLWDGCRLTHLKGVLSGEDMQRDVLLAPDSEPPAEPLFLTPGGVRRRAAVVGALTLVALLLVFTPVLGLGSRRMRSTLLLLLIGAVGPALLVGLATTIVARGMESERAITWRTRNAIRQQVRLLEGAAAALRGAALDRNEFKEYLAETRTMDLELDFPGGHTLRRDQDGALSIVVYGVYGEPRPSPR